jgi:hypothetical protein
MNVVKIRRGISYKETDAGSLTIDLYHPPDLKSGTQIPAVVFVTGYSDIGAEKMLGTKFKEMGSFVSWAQLVAVSGLIGVTYANREPGDVYDVLHHLQRSAASFGIDPTRIGIWSCSGHGPNALSVLMEHARDGLKCATLLYPYTLDVDPSTSVAVAAKQFRFVTPAAGKSVEDLPREAPILIARAGKDQMPGINEALDRFVGKALNINLPLTVVNHAAGPHAFDLVDDSRVSREIIKQALEFLRVHLLP